MRNLTFEENYSIIMVCRETNQFKYSHHLNIISYDRSKCPPVIAPLPTVSMVGSLKKTKESFSHRPNGGLFCLSEKL